MRSLNAIAYAGTSLLAIMAVPAQAQDTAAPAAAEDDASEVIIVQARRRGEDLQDVPAVVNAVTADTIEDLNLRDFKDIQTVVPGLTMASNSNGIGTTSSVRGVNFDVNASGGNGTIEYYLNDAPLSSGSIFQAMFDIGQIEVLRGPQGTLRGRASPSGSITISHRRPDLQEVGGYALGTVNDIGGWNINGGMNLPIIEDVLALRISGLVERNRGSRVRSINAPGVKPFGETQAGRVFLRFEPTDWFEAEGVYQNISAKGRSVDQVACFSQFSTAALPCPVTISPDDRLGIVKTPQTVEQKFDVFTWKASAGFAGQRLHYVGSHTTQRINAFVSADPANLIPVSYGQATSNVAKQASHELRLQNEERVAGMFDYVVGYFRQTANTPSYIVGQTAALLSGGLLGTSTTLRTNQTKEESFFGNLTAHIGESTELSGGLRHITYNSDSRLFSTAAVLPAGCAFNAAFRQTVCPPGRFSQVATDVSPIVLSGPATELVFAPQNPREFKKTIFSASVKHKFTEDFLVYANFGTSFRPGNNVVRFPPNAALSALESQFIATPQETSKSYEIGLKSQFFDRSLTLNLAAFRQDFTNYPYRSVSGVFFLQQDAPGAALRVASGNFVSPVPVRVHGVELEAAWKASDRFNLSLNLAYAIGKIRNGVVACNDFVTPDGQPDVVTTAPSVAVLQGRVGANNVSACTVNFRAMTASPWNGNLQAEYNLPVGDASEAFFRGLFTFADKGQADAANPFDDRKAYGLLNLYAGIRDPDGAWEVSAYGKNIFDDDTVLATSLGPVFTTAQGQTLNSPYIGLGNASTPGISPPREFGISLRVAFGSR